MAMGMTQHRNAALRQLLLHRKEALQGLLQVTRLLYTVSYEPIARLEGYVAQEDELDVDAPSEARPIRPGRDPLTGPEGQPAAGQATVEF